jgi:hypothetical protein
MILVCAFHLDKHRDAKRFFGPMSRDFWPWVK